jgi:hypothetical protein
MKLQIQTQRQITARANERDIPETFCCQSSFWQSLVSVFAIFKRAGPGRWFSDWKQDGRLHFRLRHAAERDVISQDLKQIIFSCIDRSG